MFLQTIHDLRIELQEYASLPKVNLADVNQLFDLSVADQARTAAQQITQEKQNYVSLLQQQREPGTGYPEHHSTGGARRLQLQYSTGSVTRIHCPASK